MAARNLETFVEMFDTWAARYDSDVRGNAWPFSSVFDGYERILSSVALEAEAGPGRYVLDVGTGTGNLTRYLLAAGARVVAVDPSPSMRRAAARKNPGVPVFEGHFLHLPFRRGSFDAVVSSYAFHHLTNEEKRRGVANQLSVLKPGGRLVIADIAFRDEVARRERYRCLREAGRGDAVEELEAEYYPTVGALRQILEDEGARVETVRQETPWVWIFTAVRPQALKPYRDVPSGEGQA